MFDSLGARLRRGLFGAVAAMACGASVLTGTAAAQTIVLNQPYVHVTDTTIRGGTYANTNYDDVPLVTRRSNDLDWERRAILKFDTQNLVPADAQIASATLTLTVRSGLGSSGQTRTIRASRVPVPFQEQEATWRLRQGSSYWSTAGGDMEEEVARGYPTSTPGSRVTFNLTTLVQRVVNGDFGSRYTRVLLQDIGSDAKESLREYYGSEDSDVSRRPTLTIVLGTGGVSQPPPAPSTGSTLRVLHWNIAQGYGTDGRSNITRVVDFIASVRPDVISFNEIMRYSSSSQPQQIAEALRARTGQNWSYKWVQKSGSSSGEGECIMSRFPLEAQLEDLLSYDRSIAGGRITVNGRTVHVFSTHLDHQSSARRLTQVREVVNFTNNYAEQRIVAGDFNGWPGTAEINEMLRTHYDGWAVARADGTAVAYPSNPDGNTRNSRIDFVFHSRGASALQVTRAQVYDTRDSSGHRPSDHNPLMVTYRVN